MVASIRAPWYAAERQHGAVAPRQGRRRAALGMSPENPFSAGKPGPTTAFGMDGPEDTVGLRDRGRVARVCAEART